jgi:hypothetical protein
MKKLINGIMIRSTIIFEKLFYIKYEVLNNIIWRIIFMDKLYIVIPAYNEEMNIEAVAREWHEVIVKIGGEKSGSNS